MTIRAGELNRRIALQSVTRTADEGGGATSAWATFATVWAKVEPLDGRERYEAQQVESAVNHRVTIRYRADVTARHRVLYGSRALAIRAVLSPDPPRQASVLLCAEEDNEEGV